MDVQQTLERPRNDRPIMAARGAQASFDDLLRDPLTRLVMASDGVTEEDMIALLSQLQRSLARRRAGTGPMQSAEWG